MTKEEQSTKEQSGEKHFRYDGNHDNQDTAVLDQNTDFFPGIYTPLLCSTGGRLQSRDGTEDLQRFGEVSHSLLHQQDQVKGMTVMQRMTSRTICSFCCSDEYESKEKIFRSLSEQHRHEVMFVVIDLDEDDNRRVIEFLGLKDETFPTMRIIQVSSSNDVVMRRLLPDLFLADERERHHQVQT